jgi:hypothetical protein
MANAELKTNLYINKLADINQDVLAELVRQSGEHLTQTHP